MQNVDDPPKRRKLYAKVQTWLPLPLVICSGVASISTGLAKFCWLSLVTGCAGGIAISKHKCETIDELERERREERTRTLENEHHQAIAQKELAHSQAVEQLREEVGRKTAKALQVVLEDFHRSYFRREEQTEQYKHRTTLFKCIDIDVNGMPQKALKVYARAGVYPESDRCWPVDENDPTKCHGVAGQIWFHGVGKVTRAACEWPNDDSPEQKLLYSKSLGISVDEAESLNVQSKTFTGAVVVAKDRKWGVILLDSLKDDLIVDEKYENELLRKLTLLVSGIIHRTET